MQSRLGYGDVVGPEEVVYERDGMRIGCLRCSPVHPVFAGPHLAGDWQLVFARVPVIIAQAGAEPVVADPARVVIYNRGQEYRRSKLAEEGDRCEWFAFDVQTVTNAVRPYDPQAADRSDRPFAFTHAPTDPRTYLLQRRLFDHVTNHSVPDVLFVEEGMHRLLADTVARAYAARGLREGRSTGHAQRTHLALVDAAVRLLARRFCEPLSLADIASDLGTSPFHLARLFRAHTGTSLHQRRLQLRLHAALEKIRDDSHDLVQIALDLGFASHSHFTDACVRVFGAPPSALRKR
jgi:AraC-like DNA-binding protein